MRGRREGKVGVSMGEATKTFFLDVSEDVLMLFCVAGMALCDIRRCVRRNVCARPS